LNGYDTAALPRVRC